MGEGGGGGGSDIKVNILHSATLLVWTHFFLVTVCLAKKIRNTELFLFCFTLILTLTTRSKGHLQDDKPVVDPGAEQCPPPTSCTLGQSPCQRLRPTATVSGSL